MNPNIPTPERVTVRIPSASGDEIEAWVYRSAGDGPHPAVVMALHRHAQHPRDEPARRASVT
jgi:hypothetical protein